VVVGRAKAKMTYEGQNNEMDLLFISIGSGILQYSTCELHII
jgi:hypothetical protein